MLFKEIAGQEEVKKKLIKSVKENRISHAQLFLGPEGNGSLLLAIAFAQYLNCENKTDDSCGTCPSCLKFNKLTHPDLHFVFPVTTTKQITKNPVSDDFIIKWREFILNNQYFSQNQWYEYSGVENKQGIISKNESYEIIRKLNLKTFEAEYKSMIIWLPEKMNQSSGNKLLKLIEEPPGKTIFLMVSENADPILPTILSRLQTIKIPKISKNDLKEALIQKYSISENVADNYAQIANGNMIKAIDLFDNKGETFYNFEKFTVLMRLCFKNNLPEINEWIDEMSSVGREKIKRFFEYALHILRESFMINQGLPEISYLDTQEVEFSKKLSPYINQTNVYDIYEEFNNAYYYIEANAYNKIVLMDLSLKLFKLIKQ